MVKFRHLLAALLVCSTLVISCVFAQSNLTQIRDLITYPDGTPFNGTLVVTWNGYTSSGTPVSQLSASASIYSGALSILLVPTTTAPAGTYYQVLYSSSDGTVTWTEVWQVPPSTTPLTLSQVRQSSTQGSGGGGSGGGGLQYATLPIAISQVTNLSSDLNSINTTITALTTQIGSLGAASLAALTSTVNGLVTTVGALTTTVTTQGTSLTALNGTVTALGTTVAGQATSLSGLNTTVGALTTTVTTQGTSLTALNGTVTALGTTVAGQTTSLSGLNTTIGALTTTVTTQGTSLGTLNGTVTTLGTTVAGQTTSVAGLNTSVTNLNNSVAGLTSTVNTLSASGTNAVFVDAEVPTGGTNGSNTSFTLSQTPAPSASLSVFRNGLLQAPGVDFNLAGAVVTFIAGGIPQGGDVIQAYYRVPGNGAATNFVDAEAPGGAINGTNLTFTLAAAPNPAASLKLYKNGLLMLQGGDYTVAGSTVTFAGAASTPLAGDSLLASYRH